MMRKRLLWTLLLALAAVAAYRSVFFVDETETVIVTQFGKPVGTHDDAGLHFKWPYRSAIRIDRRLQIYDPKPSEFLAMEKKNVDLDVFVCWRVDSPLLFLETVNDFDGAKMRIHDIVWSNLAADLGRAPLEAIVSTDPQTHRLDDLVGQVVEKSRQNARLRYGIEIVDIRLKRISLPAQVRDSVFQRMRAERARVAGQYRAEGEAEATKIRAAADTARAEALAKAGAEAERIRGQAEAEAIRTYTEAHKQDPQFYELVRTLEAYKKFLDEKTTVLLSADSELLKYLTRGSVLSEPPEKQPED